MPTPDFEDWLARQDIPIEDTVTLDRYLDYLEDELGVHGGSLEIAETAYAERYKGLEAYDIRPIARHYITQGEAFVETRYAIKGAPGLWGKFSAYRIGEERARDAGDYDAADTLGARYEQMEGLPERRRAMYRDTRPEE